MKRVIIIVCAIIFVTSNACAVSDLDIMIEGHNANCWICAAQNLTGDPVIENEKATFDLNPNLHDVFFIKDDKVYGFGCVCEDQAQESEFLAQCVTACYNFAGLQAGTVCYDVILSQFLFARAGVDSESSTKIPGIMIEISKESFGYVFMLVKVK